MTRNAEGESFERYRAVLRALALLMIPCDLQGHLLASDVVDETLAEAERDRDQCRAQTDLETIRWLKAILTRCVIKRILPADSAPDTSSDHPADPSEQGGKRPADDGDFARYRDLLMGLARQKIPADLRGRIDASDLVQETLCRAFEGRAKFRGETEAQMFGWLKAILICRLIDWLRRVGRDPSLVLDEQIDQSSACLARLLEADVSSPSARLKEEDRSIKLAQWMAERLSADELEAIILQKGHSMTVEGIARHMGRTPDALGGLLRNGRKKLRKDGWHE